MEAPESKQAADAHARKDLLIRRLIFFGLAIVVFIPLIFPFQMSGMPLEPARKVFEAVDALPDGSTILISMDFDPGSQAELDPMARALLRHCFRKNFKVIVMTFLQTGIGLHTTIVEEIAAEAEFTPAKKSGEDYVLLGFKPGYAMLIINMGENLTGAFDRDIFGEATEGMPVLEGVRSLKDLDHAIVLAAGNTIDVWIAYGRDRFGFPLSAGCTAVIAPDLYPYIDAGQLTGVLGGLRGAADYEVLINKTDKATSGMSAQNLAHLFIILLIVIANIEQFYTRWKRRE